MKKNKNDKFNECISILDDILHCSSIKKNKNLYKLILYVGNELEKIRKGIYE